MAGLDRLDLTGLDEEAHIDVISILREGDPRGPPWALAAEARCVEHFRSLLGPLRGAGAFGPGERSLNTLMRVPSLATTWRLSPTIDGRLALSEI
jgi:hypothetical protein